MRGTAVVSDKNAAAGDQRDQLAQVERIEKDKVASTLPANFGGDFGFAASEVENGLDSMLIAQFPRKSNKFVDGPALGEIFRAGMEHGVRFARWNTTCGELLGDQNLRVGLRIYPRRRNRPTR